MQPLVYSGHLVWQTAGQLTGWSLSSASYGIWSEWVPVAQADPHCILWV